MLKSFSFIFLFLGFILTAQEPVEEASKWKYDGFSYADFGTGEEHSNFSLLYKVNPKLQVELQGFYDTYRVSDVFDVSFRVKWYPVKKIYLFSGLGTQVQGLKLGASLPRMSAYMMNGVGYEPTNNISIQAVNDINLNKNSGSSGFLKLKGKYRF